LSSAGSDEGGQNKRVRNAQREARTITIYEGAVKLSITDPDGFGSLKVKIRAKKKVNAMSRPAE
jgi:hypothetical protein